MNRAAVRSAGDDIPIRRRGRPPLLAIVTPTPDGAGERFVPGTAAIVAIVDPDRSVADAETFALSKSDARLARQVCCGANFSEIAAQRAIAEGKVREEFEAILNKLALTGQADLVRLFSAVRQ